MSQQIAELVRKCELCRKESAVQQTPLLRSEFPPRPWEKLGSDLFFIDSKWYLLVVDYHSRFIEVALLDDLTSSQIISHMKSIFARHGVPELLISDNGRQYASEEFALFAKTYGFTHVTSSPRHPQGNGAAERAVQTVKNIMKKEGDPYMGLMAYRSSPLENGLSPAELLMGRRLRTTVPSLPLVLMPEQPDLDKVKLKESVSRAQSKENFDARYRVVRPPSFTPGDRVYVRDLKREAEVVNSSPDRPQSVVVKDAKGTTVRRNASRVVPLPESSDSSVKDGVDEKRSSFGRLIKPRRVLDL
jgi:hypothetical protein